METHSELMLLEDIRSYARQRLCDKHPYLNGDAIERMLNTSTAALEDGIKEQAPAVAASLARIDFFKLPPKLRNAIYDLAIPLNKPQDSSCMMSWTCFKLPQSVYNLSITSKQVRQEILSRFSGDRTFYIDIGFEHLAGSHLTVSPVVRLENPDISSLLAKGPQQCRMVGKVVLRYCVSRMTIQEHLRVSKTKKPVVWKIALEEYGFREDVVDLRAEGNAYS